MRRAWIWVLAGAALAPTPTARPAEPLPAGATPEQTEFFEKNIRPVLADHCWSCHGPNKQKGGLRLDSRTALLQGGEDGPVVALGDAAKSALIQALRYTGEIKMPPKGALPPRTVADLSAWVQMGCPWPSARSSSPGNPAWQRHWAFLPVAHPPIPDVKAADWPLTPVDCFILARLEAKGLSPAPPADRRTLLRRAAFDLTGLPPTPEELAAFEADTAPDAFPRVVDRLLTSPRYGERWGRYWLDIARYADTKGYVFFQESEFPWAYTYRDYVIRAWNDDLPYDRFILEQLAADQLDLGADRRPLTALGFLTLGGRFMNNQQDILDDRIDVVTRGLMALTVTCARCHDHKFDPIPARDYYSLYGVFASSAEPAVQPLFAEPPKSDAHAKFTKELQAREQKLADFVRSKHEELVHSTHRRVAEYLLAAQAGQQRPKTEEFMLIADGGDLNPRMLSRWRSYLQQARRSQHPVFIPWNAFSELPAEGFAEQARVRSASFLTQADSVHPSNSLVARSFAAQPPRTLADAAKRYGELLNAADQAWQTAVRQAAAERKPPPRSLPDLAQEELRQVFYGPNSPPNLAMNPLNDLDLLPDRPSQAKLQELRKAVETWRATGPGAPPRAMVMEDLPAPYQPHVFLRGNPNAWGEAVPRQFPAVVAGPPRRPFQHGSGRLELAQAIIDSHNPLTARVLVNRVWLHHFGAALVHTTSDFGMRSEPPTHPELLDYLAGQFRADGWSIKKLHRRIMLSAAYQQQTTDRPECRRLDPENSMLWRMNRRRLDFEALRDSLLAVAGRLDGRLGGAPIRDVVAPSATRRTIYGFIDRLNLPGLLRTFDFPSPDATSAQRDTTTVPPQALFLMNHPFVLECARSLCRRPDIAAERDPGRRVATLYQHLYQRHPTALELRLALDYVAAAGSSTQAWERYAQALLVANEFVFVD
jgi:mono/diheme cytochrome c family protein